MSWFLPLEPQGPIAISRVGRFSFDGFWIGLIIPFLQRTPSLWGSCVSTKDFMRSRFDVFEVKYQKTVAGLSSRTLEMYVVFFLFRLGSTLFKNGYLPIDRSLRVPEDSEGYSD